MYPEFIRGPRGVSLYRVVTVFGKKEFATIRLYCKRNRLSLYALAKAAIREYVQRHPWFPGTARRCRRSDPICRSRSGVWAVSQSGDLEPGAEPTI